MDPNWIMAGIGIISLVCTASSVYLHLKIRSELADLILDKLNGRYLKSEVANIKFENLKEEITEVKQRLDRLQAES